MNPRIPSHLTRCAARFRTCQSGAAIVEFAIALPLLLLLFAMIVEGGRMMWSYQTTAAGVRDAARYLARVAPHDICASGGSVSGYSATLLGIVRNASSGTALFPSGITVTGVTPSLTCIGGNNLRNSPAPIVRVRANLTITFPFASVFGFAGGSDLTTLNTSITDESKVYGS
jgi:hypothetical protein